jgi:hypothetical protein
MSNTDITPIAPRKFTANEVYKHVFDNHQIRIGRATINRILKAVNKVESPVEQLTAFNQAIDTEIAKLPKLPAPIYRLRAIAPPDNLVIDLDGEHPWFESRRPAWCRADNDRLDGKDDDTGIGYSRSSWSSETFSIPCRSYFGEVADGVHRLPELRSGLVQSLDDVAPRIVVERHNWDGDGSVVPQAQRFRQQLYLDEAVTLAHVLLNLVDLANESS